MDAVETDQTPRHPLQRLHRALMPDYNAAATAYWWTMGLLGAGALAYAIWRVAAMPGVALGQVLVGALLAAVAGFFPVRIPGSKHSFVAGETFIFLLLLMHGAEAAVIAAASEAFVGSARSSKRWTSRLVSPALSALAMTLAGLLMHGLFLLVDETSHTMAGLVLLVATVVSLAYFFANTLFVTLLFTFKRSERFNLTAMLNGFGSIGVAYAGSALVAALLYLTVQYSGLNVLLGALPVIAMLLTTVHYFMRQQEANDTVRRARVEAAEREAAQSARHLAALRSSEQRFHSAFTHASIGMALVGFDGRVLQANLALASLLGEDQAEVLVERSFASLVLDEDRPALEREFDRIHANIAETFAIEVRCRHRSGAELWMALHCAYFSEPGSAAPCLIVQLQDISARRHAEAQLNHIAFHDGLTGLPNRNRFHTLLGQVLTATHADPERHFAVMFLDFDRFKLINDSMGHSAGDEFLIQVSRRIQDHVRPGDVVARLGGDEFAVLVNLLRDPHDAIVLAERLQEVLREPLRIAGVNVTASASIGITFSALGYAAPEEMLRDADIAMYRAKSAGKARHAVFDAELHTEVASRVQLESDLRQALAEDALRVVYQPLFNLTTGRLYGFEALARWDHPTRGPISPEVFIPIAEETGLVVQLSDMVLARGCRQMRLWQQRHASLRDLALQVNLSGNDLAHSELADRVERVLRDTGFVPQRLTLELTENILMDRVEGALQTLETLRRIGVRLAIDDFGTGYSSLAYLSTLPIDSLKIDRSFVTGMRDSSKDWEIVRAVVSLGGALGKSVVAEGIETNEQFLQLRDLGCEQGQGFHLSRPLSPRDVEVLLDQQVAEHGLGSAAEALYTAPLSLTRH